MLRNNNTNTNVKQNNSDSYNAPVMKGRNQYNFNTVV